MTENLFFLEPLCISSFISVTTWFCFAQYTLNVQKTTPCCQIDFYSRVDEVTAFYIFLIKGNEMPFKRFALWFDWSEVTWVVWLWLCICSELGMTKQHTKSDATEIWERQTVSCFLERENLGTLWRKFDTQITLQPQCYDLQRRQKFYFVKQISLTWYMGWLPVHMCLLICCHTLSCASASNTGDWAAMDKKQLLPNFVYFLLSTHKSNINYVYWICELWLFCWL